MKEYKVPSKVKYYRGSLKNLGELELVGAKFNDFFWEFDLILRYRSEFSDYEPPEGMATEAKIHTSNGMFNYV